MSRTRNIYLSLRDQILGGVFGPDGMLPSSRALAADLGVARSTVTLAYEQLAAEGYVVLRQGARARVASRVPDRPPTREPPATVGPLSAFGERLRQSSEDRTERAMIDFRYGDLSPSDFPSKVWRKAVLSQPTDRLAYGDPRGSERLRRALQGYLWRARSLECGLDQIVVVNGSQQGLDLCARILLDAGDSFVTETPCYSIARDVFAAGGAIARPVPTDTDGLRTDDLLGLSARLVYVTPSHQFPLGGVLPVSRRRALLEWAADCDAYVIEDDYDSEYRYDIDPVPPLHRLDGSHRVIYVGTVSKTLSPALRLGYLVLPPGLADVFAKAKQLTDRHSPSATQAALATLLESGAYEAHVRKMRRIYGERRRVLLNALRLHLGPEAEVEGANAGLHVVLWFRNLPPQDEPRLIAAARELGLGLQGVSGFYAPGSSPTNAGVLLGYAALDVRRIERGVGLLAKALRSLSCR